MVLDCWRLLQRRQYREYGEMDSQEAAARSFSISEKKQRKTRLSLSREQSLEIVYVQNHVPYRRSKYSGGSSPFQYPGLLGSSAKYRLLNKGTISRKCQTETTSTTARGITLTVFCPSSNRSEV